MLLSVDVVTMIWTLVLFLHLLYNNREIIWNKITKIKFQSLFLLLHSPVSFTSTVVEKEKVHIK